jgi:hypothetical protein
MAAQVTRSAQLALLDHTIKDLGGTFDAVLRIITIRRQQPDHFARRLPLTQRGELKGLANLETMF